MTAIATTTPSVEALGRSPPVSRTSKRDEVRVANTPRLQMDARGPKSESVLSDALEGDNRQLFPPRAILDHHLDNDAGPSSNERMRRRTGRASRPSRARLESRPPASWELPEIALIRRASAESRVRPLCVVPGDVVFELARECSLCQGHDRQASRALVLHRRDEPLDDGDATVLADGAEVLLDSATTAPGPGADGTTYARREK